MLGCVVAIIHNNAFGREMAHEAIEYNNALYEEFQWSYPVLQGKF